MNALANRVHSGSLANRSNSMDVTWIYTTELNQSATTGNEETPMIRHRQNSVPLTYGRAFPQWACVIGTWRGPPPRLMPATVVTLAMQRIKPTCKRVTEINFICLCKPPAQIPATNEACSSVKLRIWNISDQQQSVDDSQINKSLLGYMTQFLQKQSSADRETSNI